MPKRARWIPRVGIPAHQPIDMSILRQVHAALTGLAAEPVTEGGAIVPAQPPAHERPRTAADLERLALTVPYPRVDGYCQRPDKYAATMRAWERLTGTTGLGDFWQQTVFTAPAPTFIPKETAK